MATFRKIHTTFWTDPYVEELTQEQKLFYLYLITNTKTSQSGIYEITKKYIAYETGFTPKQVNELLSFFEGTDKISYSAETNEIAIINWSKFNYNKSHKVLKCIYDDLQLIKSTELIKKIYNEVYIQKLIDEESKYSVLIEYLLGIHTVSIPKLQQEEEQAQEEVQEEVQVQPQVELEEEEKDQEQSERLIDTIVKEPPLEEGGSIRGWDIKSTNKLNELKSLRQ